MMRTVSVLALLVALAACNGEAAVDGESARDGAAPVATASASPSAAASASGDPAPADSPAATSARADSRSGGARTVEEETDDFLFAYSYPAQAGRIEDLAALLDRRLDRARGELATESAQARRQAREDGFPYNKHSYSAEWKVVAALPDWLSLSNDIATYSGGAHGNYTKASLVWDKKRGRAMDGIELFASPAALEEALGERFCDGLDRQRERKRGKPLEDPPNDDTFTGCPDIGELEVLVGSSNGRTFNRLTLYAGPYVAGPYVEGAYEVDLAVDRAIRDAVKPEYRAAFTARN